MATTQRGISGQVNGQPFFIGTWWWRLCGIKQATRGIEPADILRLLADNHVTEIYLDASGMYRDGEDGDPHGASISEVRAFAAECHARGIRLSALTGCSRERVVEWMNPARGYPEMNGFFDLVEEYNRLAAEGERFAAVHLDVEPHSAKRFRTERRAMMQLYADTMLLAAERCHAMGLELETDVCGDMRDNDFVTVNGQDVPIMDALFQACDTITVMAYRREATRQMEFGTNRYLPYAMRYGKRLVVGSETMEPQYDLTIDDIPKEITYASVGRDVMLREMDRLQHLLIETGAPKVGIAIHHVYSWYDLFEAEKAKASEM